MRVFTSIYRSVAKALFKLVPKDNYLILRFCERYMDRRNGDNNSDPSSNGEERLLREEMPKLKGGCVFDVGANVGKWAEFVLGVEPTIRLHCFEPSAATFKQLSSKKFPPQVRLNNVGLGERDGEVELNVIQQGSGLNSIYVRQGIEAAQAVSREWIRIITIDAYCADNQVDRIDFLKIDVEGHELAVFKGMTRLLEHGCIGAIQFEYGGSNLDARVYLRDIWDFLQPYGFQFFKLHPDGAKPIPEYQQSMETFKYSNFLATRVHGS